MQKLIRFCYQSDYVTFISFDDNTIANLKAYKSHNIFRSYISVFSNVLCEDFYPKTGLISYLSRVCYKDFVMDLKIFTIFAIFVAGLECSRILVLYPSISKSHVMPLQSLSVSLAEAGHDITFVSTYPLGKKVKNYRDVKVPFDEADKAFIEEAIKDPNGKGLLYMFPIMTSLLFRLSNDSVQLPEMQRMMKEEKFDLVIIGYFLTDSVIGLADHFKCPSVLFSSSHAFSPLNRAIGNPLAGTVELNFIGRLKSFLITGIEFTVFQYLKYYARQVYE